MAMTKPRLCVLLPAFNEAAHIADVVSEVRAVPLEGVEVTVLVVNDGSADDTASRASAAGATVVDHLHNRGVGAAFRTGRDFALEHGADYLVHMDADGQLLPAEIPRLLTPLLEGRADLVLGSRFLGGSAPASLEPWKAVALRTAARGLGLLTGYHLTDISCGFRGMDRRIMEAVCPSFDYDYIQETLVQALAAHARLVEVPVSARYGEAFRGKAMSSRALRYSTRFLQLTGYSLLGFYRARGEELWRMHRPRGGASD
jgi:glycosyltransferase involved in cell wall biosynthesis